MPGPEITYIGGFITALCGVAMAIVAVLDRRQKSAERRFDEVTEMWEIARAGEQHARNRVEQIRAERDEVLAERDEWKRKWQRGEITIAQLREKLEMCDAKVRTYRRVLMRHGITRLDEDPDSGRS